MDHYFDNDNKTNFVLVFFRYAFIINLTLNITYTNSGNHHNKSFETLIIEDISQLSIWISLHLSKKQAPKYLKEKCIVLTILVR